MGDRAAGRPSPSIRTSPSTGRAASGPPVTMALCGLHSAYALPGCPGSLLPVQAFLWSVACGHRLLPQVWHNTIRCASAGMKSPGAISAPSFLSRRHCRHWHCSFMSHPFRRGLTRQSSGRRAGAADFCGSTSRLHGNGAVRLRRKRHSRVAVGRDGFDRDSRADPTRAVAALDREKEALRLPYGHRRQGCQWRSKTAEIWRHRKSGHENCRPGAGSRAGASPAQQTLDAAEGRIRWGMAVSAAVPRLQPC